MKFIILATALAAAVPAVFGLTINSPANVAACEPTQLSWSGGTAPYFLSVLPAGQPAATPLEQLPTQNGTSYTWNVNFASGTSFTIALKDSTGVTVYTSIITVTAGTDNSCVNASAPSGSSASGTSGGATPSVGSGSSSGSTAGAGAGATTSPSSGSATTTASGSSASTTKSSGAGRFGVSSAFGVAGVMGLVGAMLF